MQTKTKLHIYTKEEKIYVTDDGQEFTDIQAAKSHELQLKDFRKICHKTIYLNLMDERLDAYYISGEEDFDYLIVTEWDYNINDSYYDNPGWYIARTIPGGDYKDSYVVEPITEYLKMAEHDLNELRGLK